jgi:8-amino-7-oxononanoate synthase
MARLETPGARLKLPGVSAAPRRLDPAQLNGYRELRLIEAAAAELGIADPFFRAHDGIAGAETTIDDRRIGNFASYDYLALNGDPRITGAAKAAIDRYGTSVSASRMVSGERPIHHELETELARLYDADDAITLVSGHATNVSLIGALLGPGDIIVHDALVHNSIFEGGRQNATTGKEEPGGNDHAVERPRRGVTRTGAHTPVSYITLTIKQPAIL